MAINVGTTMDALGIRLKTISGLRVYDFMADNIAAPAAVVGMPNVSYDATKGRGVDRAVYPVHLLVGKVSDRASRDKLSPFVAGTGAKSVKAAIDGTLGDTVQAARVVDASVSVMAVGAVDYLAVTFNTEVWQ